MFGHDEGLKEGLKQPLDYFGLVSLTPGPVNYYYSNDVFLQIRLKYQPNSWQILYIYEKHTEIK